jgi:hypothetical protein
VSEATGSGTFAVRASAGEQAAWRRQAELAGTSRNDWIRYTLNKASSGRGASAASQHAGE